MLTSKAYVGSAVVEGAPSVGNEQKDLRDLGLLMVRLMELGTSLKNPGSLGLLYLKRWDEATKYFLESTARSPLAELRQVSVAGGNE